MPSEFDSLGDTGYGIESVSFGPLGSVHKGEWIDFTNTNDNRIEGVVCAFGTHTAVTSDFQRALESKLDIDTHDPQYYDKKLVVVVMETLVPSELDLPDVTLAYGTEKGMVV